MLFGSIYFVYNVIFAIMFFKDKEIMAQFGATIRASSDLAFKVQPKEAPIVISIIWMCVGIVSGIGFILGFIFPIYGMIFSAGNGLSLVFRDKLISQLKEQEEAIRSIL